MRIVRNQANIERVYRNTHSPYCNRAGGDQPRGLPLRKTRHPPGRSNTQIDISGKSGLSGVFLPVVGTWAVLAVEVFVQQFRLERFAGRFDPKRFTGQASEVFQDFSVLDRLGG